MRSSSSSVLLSALVMVTLGTARAADRAADDLVKQLAPSIVGITVTPNLTAPAASAASSASGASPLPDGPRGAGAPATGSGTFISPDGLVLTSCSMFGKPGDVQVTLEGGQSLKGTVVGLDKRLCLALVKVPVTQHAYVRIAPMRDLMRAEQVLGLGRPVTGAQSQVAASDGVVRHVYGVPGVEWMIDSAMLLPPGFSGGPLVRERTGELIGINYEQYEAPNGALLTSATPINAYLRIESDLRAKGRVQRFNIGIRVANLKRDDARGLQVPDEKGVLISEVKEGGAAHMAGLMLGDVVLEADGFRVADATELITIINERPAGTLLKLKYVRRGEVREVTLTPVPYTEAEK